MFYYFLRRILFLIPAFFGITIISFLILQFVPGGPLELELLKMKMGTGEEVSTGSAFYNNTIPESALNEMKKFYGYDKPILERYTIWLTNILKFNLGKSYAYNEPVFEVITSRFPVSIYFGFIGFILTYLICVPLGTYKAVKNGSKFDFLSSAVVFAGYSVPGWAFGAMALIFLGGGSFLNVFPLGGFHSEGFESLGFFEKITDLAYYTILPISAYVVGSFATLTILTKNAVMESLSQDYIKTAYLKGLKTKRVVINHALRNSLIPITTGLGHFLGLVLAGSFLIEKVFNINGMGLLGYNSIINRDYPVTMGILVFSSILLMLGNIITDILYAIVDPRIRFK